MPPSMGADVPSRINRDQICRPKEVAQIKPKQSSRDQTTFDHWKRECFAQLGAKSLLHPNGDNSGRGSSDEERDKRFQIPLPAQFSALPPKENEKNGR